MVKTHHCALFRTGRPDWKTSGLGHPRPPCAPYTASSACIVIFEFSLCDRFRVRNKSHDCVFTRKKGLLKVVYKEFWVVQVTCERGKSTQGKIKHSNLTEFSLGIWDSCDHEKILRFSTCQSKDDFRKFYVRLLINLLGTGSYTYNFAEIEPF